MAEPRDDQDGLSAFWGDAMQPVAVSEDLMGRVMADAERLSRMRRADPVWVQIKDALGGWVALGGLAAASLAGVWIGIAPPVGLPDPVQVLVGQDSTAITEIWGGGIFDASAILEES